MLGGLLLFSCSENKIKVEGDIMGESYNGETVYLYYPNSLTDFQAFEQLGTAKIVDGNFSFDISLEDGMKKEAPTVGYLTMSDMNAIKEDTVETENTPVATFIIENGEINVSFDGTSVVLSGTPRNNAFNEIHLAIKDLVDFANSSSAYASIDELPLDSNGRDGRAQFQAYNGKLSDLTYKFVLDNISNNAGEYLFLRSYTDNLFTPVQLKTLIDASSDKFKAKTEVKWLIETLSQMSDDQVELESPIEK